jgi:hypothetical protein
MATYIIRKQLTLPGIPTESAFYAQMQMQKAKEEARKQAEFEMSMTQPEPEDKWAMFGAQEGQHTNGVCEYVLIWSDGEDSRWAMTPSENPYL